MLDREHGSYSIADEEMVRVLSRAEGRHFWHLSRNRLISDNLSRLGFEPPARVLDLGCGGGCVAAHLAQLGYSVTGVDGHLPRILEAAARAPSARFIVDDVNQGNFLSEEGGFDVVALFDVIEHVDAPGALLGKATDLARPGGCVAGTVPALMALWSDADRRAGHRVRYQRRTLAPLLASVRDGAVVEITYFNRVLVPFLWLQRRILDRGGSGDSGERYFRVPWEPANLGMYALARLEHRLDTLVPWLRNAPGASLWFSVRKAERGSASHAGR